ncbi:MAG TPA: D-2-hydroxyacid dehydrogenase [Fimbriimonadaceae bacterium]|nr:D-2-hydroxyacid dehydrogenase [Fimbriimonadaceae bacterium]
MPSSLTIWCNAKFDAAAQRELEAGAESHRLVVPETVGGNLSVGGASELLAQADVAFGQPDPGQVVSLKNLRWVHLTSAGYTRYDREDVRAAIASRGARLTNSSGVFDDPCAQHLLALMLAHARRLSEAFAAQAEGPEWIYDRLRGRCRILEGDAVLILGYGAIARRLVELLAPFNLRVIAVRQHVKGDEAIPVYPAGEVLRLLPEADHVVNVLPSSATADGLVDAEFLAAIKPGAAFYNVGRGTTVNQPALISALESGQVDAAYLDVTDPEPLPSDHPLWRAPNCFITPHIAGGHQDEDSHMVRHFLANLRRFERGEPLVDVVMA